jgi:hypothetical protein
LPTARHPQRAPWPPGGRLRSCPPSTASRPPPPPLLRSSGHPTTTACNRRQCATRRSARVGAPPSVAARQVVPGAGDFWGGEERSVRVGARSALRKLTCRILFEQSERSERSELCGTTRTRAPQWSRRSRPPQHEPAPGTPALHPPQHAPRSRPSRKTTTGRSPPPRAHSARSGANTHQGCGTGSRGGSTAAPHMRCHNQLSDRPTSPRLPTACGTALFSPAWRSATRKAKM